MAREKAAVSFVNKLLADQTPNPTANCISHLTSWQAKAITIERPLPGEAWSLWRYRNARSLLNTYPTEQQTDTTQLYRHHLLHKLQTNPNNYGKSLRSTIGALLANPSIPIRSRPYLDLPAPDARAVAAIRFDTFSPWRQEHRTKKRKSKSVLHAPCPLCDGGKRDRHGNTIAKADHFTVHCQNPTIIRLRTDSIDRAEAMGIKLPNTLKHSHWANCHVPGINRQQAKDLLLAFLPFLRALSTLRFTKPAP
jgi:hypothetical protein